MFAEPFIKKESSILDRERVYRIKSEIIVDGFQEAAAKKFRFKKEGCGFYKY